MRILPGKRQADFYGVFLARIGLIGEVRLKSGLLIRGRIEAVNRDFVDLKERGRARRIEYSVVSGVSFPKGDKISDVSESVAPLFGRKVGRNTLYRSTVKTTLQLPEAAIDRLDEIIPELRRHMPRTQRSFVTKGLIVDLMTELGLEQLRGEGKESSVVRKLESKIASRRPPDTRH